MEEEQDTAEKFCKEVRGPVLGLYRLANPEAPEEALEEAAHAVAWTATQSEARRRSCMPGWAAMDASWKGLLDACTQDLEAGKHEEAQPGAPVKTLPSVRRERARTTGAAEGAVSSGTPVYLTARELAARGAFKARQVPFPAEDKGEDSPPGFHWHRLVAKAQARRRWSVRGQALNYARNGMPQNLDGPARGFGNHRGRWDWGWREIACSW